MRLVFVGDVMLGRLVNARLAACPPEYPWGDTLPLLHAADAVFINLECVLSDRGEPWPGKVFTFRSDARNVAVLSAARVTAASLANNHSLDYGPDALLDCLAVLRERRILAAGAGASLEAARRPAVCAIRGGRAALVAFTDNEPGWEAGPAAPGIFYVPLAGRTPRLDALLGAVADARRRSDLVIVSAHWGPNWGRAPLPEHVEAARLLVDAGADVVFGHSPHICRGVEVYRERPILYSCGDYIDDYAVDPVERNDESCIFRVDCASGRVRRVVLTPTVIREFQARLAHGRERAGILDTMRRLCAELGTATRDVAEGLEIPCGAGPAAVPGAT